MVSTNVLCDATGFARSDFGSANVVQQRGLAVVHVAHDGHHRRTWQQLGVLIRHFVVSKGFWIVQCSHHRFVTHFFHHDHGGILVQGLVHGGHLAQLHQVLDDLRGLDGHLVGQLGHGDGLGHMDFQHAHFGWCLLALTIITVTVITASATWACAPVVTANTATGVTTRGNRLFLGRITRPTGRQFGRLDFFVCARSGGCCSLGCSCTCSGCGRACRFVQSAFDSCFGFHFGLIFFGHQHLFRGVHHGPYGFGFGQCLAPT